MYFYTYAYLREDKTPYYIGKGEKDRIYKKGKGEVKPPKDKSRVIFLKQNLTEEEAFKHEIYMIAVFGRKDLGTGILRNKTNGGEGCSGLIRTPEARAKMSAAKKGENHPFYGKTHSAETRSKMSAVKKGKPHSPEHSAKVGAARKGKTLSPETRAKIGKGLKGKNTWSKGKKLTEEHKQKLKESRKKRKFNGENHPNKKTWELTFIDGNTIIVTVPNVWCLQNGYNRGEIYKLKNGLKKYYKNIIKIEEI